jgi:microcompartment protein CcmL/EutN
LQPAIAVIELNSISRGFRTLDEMIKKADIQVLEATVICPGKYTIVVGGLVGPVTESYHCGVDVGEQYVVDQLLLSYADEQLIPAINATNEVGEIEALGVSEFFSVTAGILSADAACKAAEVTLIELRLARGMAGKSFFTLCGPLEMVEAAIAAAEDAAAQNSGFLLRTDVIPRPHRDLIKHVL